MLRLSDKLGTIVKDPYEPFAKREWEQTSTMGTKGMLNVKL
jgi:hypothetical protein